MRWLAAVLALSVLLVAAGSAVRPQSASADPAIVGYPNSIASLGDSITRAFDADPTMFGEQLENSWSTGTSSSVDSIYSRLLAVHSPISGNRYNDAVSGAQMAGLNGQAQNAVSQGANLVLILMGANDVCTSSEASMTPVATFQTQFLQAMQTLSSGLPDARIAVMSIPDVYNLWSIRHSNSSATFTWSAFGICQSLLANPTSMAAADVQRRANVRQRTIDFNTVLHDGCALYAHCRFDNYVGFNTVFTTDDVSTLDYFHPSVSGQALIAAVAWANFYDFSDTTAPASGSSSSMATGGVSVTLTATDNVGVNGIEYKIGAGGYATYSAPVMVTTPASFTWRAVDVNGNVEATHTCWLGGWSWPSGDSDCDGFPDSVSIGPPNALASEAFMGTDPNRECAADKIRNNEPGPAAWPVDFDDNQLANGQDLLMFAPVFGSIGPNPPYNPRFDLNGDGRINGQDLLKFAPFFGKRCAP
jgi:lysophospholipase L1-like esterase